MTFLNESMNHMSTNIGSNLDQLTNYIENLQNSMHVNPD